MTIQETTDKYIHDRTCKLIQGEIKKIRDILLNIDSPLKSINGEIYSLLADRLIELGLERASFITTLDFEREHLEKYRVPQGGGFFITDKFKGTRLYACSYKHEFDKFWNECENKMKDMEEPAK